MTRAVRIFLAVEAAVFITAALVHAGALMRGYEHVKARTAESVIAFVLLAALTMTTTPSLSSRGIGLAAQGFALLGTMVGLFTIAIGVGPRTTLDLALHGIMILLLAAGLFAVGRRWGQQPRGDSQAGRTPGGCSS